MNRCGTSNIEIVKRFKQIGFIVEKYIKLVIVYLRKILYIQLISTITKKTDKYTSH